MKNIKYGFLFLVLVGIGLGACKKEDKVVQPDTTLRNISTQNSLFEYLILKDYQRYKLTKFSKYLIPFNIKEIDILEIVDDHIVFKTYSGESELIINHEKYVLDEKIFLIKRRDNLYIIKNDYCSISLRYNFIAKEFFINLHGQEINVNKIEQDPPDKICSDFIVLATLLHEFVKEELVRGFLPDFELKYKYRGTGIGFHLNLSDAHYFCRRDHDAILAANPEWFSPGINYSCNLARLILYVYCKFLFNLEFQ